MTITAFCFDKLMLLQKVNWFWHLSGINSKINFIITLIISFITKRYKVHETIVYVSRLAGKSGYILSGDNKQCVDISPIYWHNLVHKKSKRNKRNNIQV